MTWKNRPVVQIGWFVASWSGGWIFGTTAGSGFNQDYDGVTFAFPVGQMGADPGRHWHGDACGTGAKTRFGYPSMTEAVSYTIDRSGTAHVWGSYLNGQILSGSGVSGCLLAFNLPFRTTTTGAYENGSAVFGVGGQQYLGVPSVPCNGRSWAFVLATGATAYVADTTMTPGTSNWMQLKIDVRTF